MNPQYFLIIGAWIVTLLATVLLVPKDKVCLAVVAFQFKQIITWVLGLVVSQLGLIVYPVRSLPAATATSFDFEYFVYPCICALFMVYFPSGKSLWIRFLYYCGWTSAITAVEVVVEHFTDIIDYIHWTWYISWITIFATLWLARVMVLWFFRRLQKEGWVKQGVKY